jgi:cell division protein FtsB
MSVSGDHAMNFKKLSKEKRKQLFSVVAGTVAVIAALGYLLVHGGYQRLSRLEQQKIDARARLEQMERTVAQADQIAASEKAARAALDEREASMASGDLYSWMHGAIRRFQRPYKLDIPQIGAASEPTKVDLVPQFPYQQSAVAVSGSAYYHDLGQFIADFENNFPLMRIQNLSLEQQAGPEAADREKLSFRMDIVALVKP